MLPDEKYQILKEMHEWNEKEEKKPSDLQVLYSRPELFFHEIIKKEVGLNVKFKT
ncbi:hypothetical protein [Methanosarcina siciliae]|uniref:hypothetical protein n=1 Tax=Methanosarcina siciliae TaxID=38027 RepID=UPI0018CE96A8|nr:hypothetical protein [Methanosarcina siciliae]